MEKFFAITPVNQDPFLITWDLGRRCNYDCSYCPAHRHDNVSSHASLEDLKDTANFIFEYIGIISKHRINKDFHISFTGGEPTVNPKFAEFAEYVRSKYNEKFKNQFNLKLDLTTNGAMSQKIAAAVIDNFDYITVSYHAEAADKLKESVKARILQFKDSNIFLKVNVMFHAEYFEECKNLANWLDNHSVRYISRTIGEDPDSAFSQAHRYSSEQKQWLKIDTAPQHRPCCGGRTFGVCSSQGTTQTKSVDHREFKDWSCSVNWYFLHVEQQTGLIYHHQTCQAKLDGTRGSIGSLNAWQELTSSLENNLTAKTMPIIVCPNKLCGCGLCTPKSEKRQVLLENLPLVVNDISIFS
jgi:MoaA/NifB/PqqE/SkfB family radical SAM enzyme